MFLIFSDIEVSSKRSEINEKKTNSIQISVTISTVHISVYLSLELVGHGSAGCLEKTGTRQIRKRKF